MNILAAVTEIYDGDGVGILEATLVMNKILNYRNALLGVEQSYKSKMPIRAQSK